MRKSRRGKSKPRKKLNYQKKRVNPRFSDGEDSLFEKQDRRRKSSRRDKIDMIKLMEVAELNE